MLEERGWQHLHLLVCFPDTTLLCASTWWRWRLFTKHDENVLSERTVEWLWQFLP